MIRFTHLWMCWFESTIIKYFILQEILRQTDQRVMGAPQGARKSPKTKCFWSQTNFPTYSKWPDLFLCMSVLSAYFCAPHASWAYGGCRTPCNWSYTQLWASLWVLGTELGSSGTVESAFNGWGFSPVSTLTFKGRRQSEKMFLLLQFTATNCDLFLHCLLSSETLPCLHLHSVSKAGYTHPCKTFVPLLNSLKNWCSALRSEMECWRR